MYYRNSCTKQQQQKNDVTVPVPVRTVLSNLETKKMDHNFADASRMQAPRVPSITVTTPLQEPVVIEHVGNNVGDFVPGSQNNIIVFGGLYWQDGWCILDFTLVCFSFFVIIFR